MISNCQVCRHDIDNHGISGCYVPSCKCNRTHRLSDHPTYEYLVRENIRLRAVVEAARAMQAALDPVAEDGTRKTFMLANLVAAREKLDAAISALDAKGGS